MNAIIRHATSGELFLAAIDAGGTVEKLSAALPTERLARDGDGVSWDDFATADLFPWEDPAESWQAEAYVVVHPFD